jgi:preprotein translocase SecE subunit
MVRPSWSASLLSSISELSRVAWPAPSDAVHDGAVVVRVVGVAVALILVVDAVTATALRLLLL